MSIFSKLLWLFAKLKVSYTLIYGQMLYLFLFQYSGNRHLYLNLVLTVAFSIMMLSMHFVNNFFDYKEDEIAYGKKVTRRYGWLTISMILYAGALGMLLFYQLNPLLLLVLSMLCILYSMPIYKGIRIKNILFLKNITGSFFWWYLSFTLVPYMYTGYTGSYFDIFNENIPTLLTFMPFETLGDLRDYRADKENNVRTIPVVYGFTAAKLLIASLYLYCILLSLTNPWKVFLLLIPLGVFTMLYQEKTSRYAFDLMLLYVTGYIFFKNLLPIL